MSWRIETAAIEAERLRDILHDHGQDGAAALCDLRAGTLRDALAMLEMDAETEAAADAQPDAEDEADAALPDATPAQGHQQDLADLAAAAIAAGEAPAQPASPSADGERYTPERRALLAELWGDLSLTTGQVLARINALPGPPIASTEALRMGARNRCRLPGSRYAYADSLTGARPAPAPAAAEAPAAAPAPAADPRAAIPADELAEAKDMLRASGTGAKALAEYFGWELPRAQEIAALLRAELHAEERAA